MRNTTNDKIIDSMLVVQCRTGNKKALALLVKRWHPKLCRQANWYVNDKDLSKDLAQDSWSVIIRKMHHLENTHSFGSWALMIVTRTSLDWIRKNKRETAKLQSHYHSAQQDVSLSSKTSTNKSLNGLTKAIQLLPAKQQETLHLFYMEELSIREISVVLSVSQGTVKSRLFNAREKLKSIIKTWNHEK